MPYNGAGVFNRLYSWVQDAANALFISSTRMDNEMNGMATGLTNCLTRDGQSPWLANQPASGFKVTGLANGTAATDSMAFGQMEYPGGTLFPIGSSGATFNFAADSGRTQTVTLTSNATMTLLNPTVTTRTGYYYLQVTQDGTGGRTLAFAGASYVSTRWLDHIAAPTVSMPANSVTWLAFFWSGVAWIPMTIMGYLGRQRTYQIFVYRVTSNQATVANTLTKVQFNGEVSDPYSEFDAVTNFRWTPANPGLYQINYTLLVQNASADIVTTQWQFAGSSQYNGVQFKTTAASDTVISGTFMQSVSASMVTSGLFGELFFDSITGAGTIKLGQLNSLLQITRLADIE